MHKNIPRYLLFLWFVLVYVGCTKHSIPIGDVLYKKTGNELYQTLNADSLTLYFKSYLSEQRNTFKNPKYLYSFYADRNYEPVLLNKFYADSSLFYFIQYLEQINEHGLSAKSYHISKLKETLELLAKKDRIIQVKEAYEGIVNAELRLAEALTKYSFSLEYGALNPQKLLPRYYIPISRPDSLAFNKILSTQNLRHYLDSIQPKQLLYQKLQKAFKKNESHAVNRMAYAANLERLRWKFKVDSAEMVYVNIPSYHLTVFKDAKPWYNMKVVVGKADGHETPMLISDIHSVQVNPIWNIPTSIAKREILVQAKADKFYLANHGIDVYAHGKKVQNADSIDWSVYNEENLPYNFKQQPGNTNSLGLIKFLFKNGSSVYLHDTPSKATFSRKMRAASHGCVRVEKPLDLAHAIFGDGDKYELIKEEMASTNPTARTVSLKPPVQVVLNYMTAETDSLGKLKLYPDVYKLDSLLYRRLQ